MFGVTPSTAAGCWTSLAPLRGSRQTLHWHTGMPAPHSRAFEGKETSAYLGQPLRRQSERSPALLLHQYLELALEHLGRSVYQIRLGAHCDTPAISGNRG